MLFTRDIGSYAYPPRPACTDSNSPATSVDPRGPKSGKYGGYSLVKKPADITLYDVVSAMEDEPALPGQDSFCEVTDKGAAELVVGTYQMLQTGLEKSLASTTIEQIAEKKAMPQPEFATA